MKKTIYKTVIKLEVLSDYPIPSNLTLLEIASEGDGGDFWITKEYTKITNKPIKGIRAVRELESKGSYAGFFNMDGTGKEEEN